MGSAPGGNRIQVTSGRRRKAWLPRWLAAWALLFVLWLLLVGTVAPSEIVAGIAAAAVAATAVEVVRRQGVVRFRPDPRWLRRAWGLPWQTLEEFGRLVAAVWRSLVLRRRVVGRFSDVPFPVGGNDSRSAARRAVFTVGASFAPNTYVVDFDRGEGRVQVHRLVPPHPKDLEDLLP
jgi:hypothetical protein